MQRPQFISLGGGGEGGMPGWTRSGTSFTEGKPRTTKSGDGSGEDRDGAGITEAGLTEDSKVTDSSCGRSVLASRRGRKVHSLKRRKNDYFSYMKPEYTSFVYVRTCVEGAREMRQHSPLAPTYFLHSLIQPRETLSTKLETLAILLIACQELNWTWRKKSCRKLSSASKLKTLSGCLGLLCRLGGLWSRRPARVTNAQRLGVLRLYS